MQIHLVDGTYELFRHFFAMPSHRDADGREVAAVRGVIASILGMITAGATHVGVATDHVIESFRNGCGVATRRAPASIPTCSRSFRCSRKRSHALGVVVWPMVEFEADDALAAAAEIAATDRGSERVIICTPDKDLAQSVRGTRVVQLNRRTRTIMDEAGVIAKFGVPPASIPDYLALVGDSADGYPGLSRLGREVGGRGPRAIRPHRGDPRGLADVGRERRQRRRAVARAGRGPRPRTSVPHAGDASHRPAVVPVG